MPPYKWTITVKSIAIVSVRNINDEHNFKMAMFVMWSTTMSYKIY